MYKRQLYRGNAARERGFSINCAVVTKERGSLSEKSIVALRVVKEAVRLFDSCTNVPVTKDLLHAVKDAHSECTVFLENECKRKLSGRKRTEEEGAG